MVKTKCPYCGKENVRECQIKDLECNLDIYNFGDKVETDQKWLWSIAECKSDDCNRNDRGVGQFFNLKIKVKKGKITKKYRII
nr:MAG TPA: hypothetical protein [Caudoviricetes sp.]